MVCERYHHAAVTHNEKIYIFGGYCDKRYLKSYEIYDPKTNEWELVPTGEDITCYDVNSKKKLLEKATLFFIYRINVTLRSPYLLV